MLLEVASPGRRHLKPKAPGKRSDPLANSGLASTGTFRWKRERRVLTVRLVRNAAERGSNLVLFAIGRRFRREREMRMEWLEDDEMMRQREEMSKEEEKTTLRRNDGRKIKSERMQNVPELMVSQAQMKTKEATEEKEKNNLVGSSTQMMDEVRSKREVEDSEKMV